MKHKTYGRSSLAEKKGRKTWVGGWEGQSILDRLICHIVTRFFIRGYTCFALQVLLLKRPEVATERHRMLSALDDK